jgi:hypothetical protein
MKRILAIAAFAAALTMIGVAYSESPKAGAMKAGKLLVKKLPAGTEGVELVSGKVKLKSGYKFVKQRNGGMKVAMMRGGGGGGLGLGGTWSCNCYGKDGKGGTGTCTTTTVNNFLQCQADTCSGSCMLVVQTSGLATRIMAY